MTAGSFITLKVDNHNNVYDFGRMDKNNRIAVVLNNDSVAHEVEVPVHMLEIADGKVLKNELSGTEVKVVVHQGQISVSVPPHSGTLFAN